MTGPIRAIVALDAGIDRDLLRTALRESDAQEITLGRELEFVRAYLEVEEVRFQDRLSVDWRIDPVALRKPFASYAVHPEGRHGDRSAVDQSRIVR